MIIGLVGAWLGLVVDGCRRRVGERRGRRRYEIVCDIALLSMVCTTLLGNNDNAFLFLRLL